MNLFLAFVNSADVLQALIGGFSVGLLLAAFCSLIMIGSIFQSIREPDTNKKRRGNIGLLIGIGGFFLIGFLTGFFCVLFAWEFWITYKLK